MAIRPAKILSTRTFQSAGKLSITEYFFSVPRDHLNPSLGDIKLFARSAKKHETPINPPKEQDSLPWMLFLQGGPGLPNRAPQHCPWTRFVLDKGYQLLHLDTRGTGFSTPITASSLLHHSKDPAEQAEYMKLFRAPNIVADCEAIRLALTTSASSTTEQKAAGQKWSVLGQSFGGFCIVTYLSFFPQGLRDVFLFGGLQPLVTSPDPVYKALYPRVAERNRKYYEKFPEDVENVRKVVDHLRSTEVVLPSGGILTQERFATQGITLGFNGGLDAIHDMVLRCVTDLELFGHLTRPCLHQIDAPTSTFDLSPIYALLHEPIYCHPPSSRDKSEPSAWSAHRVKESFPEFSTSKEITASSPFYFTGEMIYPFMFSETKVYSELSQLAHVAKILNEDTKWSALYDIEALKKNEVPVYAASYVDDMYVDFNLGMETARTIKGCKTFVTNLMYHGALRTDTDEVLRKLWQLKEDVFD